MVVLCVVSGILEWTRSWCRFSSGIVLALLRDSAFKIFEAVRLDPRILWRIRNDELADRLPESLDPPLLSLLSLLIHLYCESVQIIRV